MHAPASAPAMAEALLLSGLDVRASIFHIGQYCGRWEASLSGRLRAGFHIVLHGDCWLHTPQGEAVALRPGDAVFFLRDTPHVLSPRSAPPDFSAPVQRRDMTPLDSAMPQATGLVCGFLDFRPGLSGLLIESLPSAILLHGQAPGLQAARTLVDLLVAEMVGRPGEPSPLIERLVELLLFYALRNHARYDTQAHGLLALARDPGMASLIGAMIAEPQLAWTVDMMASHAHMSRASFHRRFSLLAATTPAQLLLYVRMRAAVGALAEGMSVEQVCERVGYQSPGAFSRAFTRAMGCSPAVWRKERASHG
ncbi:Transcriptional regulator, AraC family [plant metagenome]|uniref:Transcriptional regulator, AraC family n=2 Tax=plant metagenome TaxID=1297885 RepID=A0A484UHM4_9ZZZZ